MRESGTFLDSSACAILVIHLVCLLLFRHIVGLGAVEDGLVGDGPLAITYAPSLRTAMSRVSTHHALAQPRLDLSSQTGHPLARTRSAADNNARGGLPAAADQCTGRGARGRVPQHVIAAGACSDLVEATLGRQAGSV